MQPDEDNRNQYGDRRIQRNEQRLPGYNKRAHGQAGDNNSDRVHAFQRAAFIDEYDRPQHALGYYQKQMGRYGKAALDDQKRDENADNKKYNQGSYDRPVKRMSETSFAKLR